ncbi:unnamed protein product [Urochloa humidicola]
MRGGAGRERGARDVGWLGEEATGVGEERPPLLRRVLALVPPPIEQCSSGGAQSRAAPPSSAPPSRGFGPRSSALALPARREGSRPCVVAYRGRAEHRRLNFARIARLQEVLRRRNRPG